MSLLLSEKGVFVVAAETTYNTDAIDSALAADEDITFLAVNSGVSLEAVDEQYEPDRFRPGADGVAHTMIPDHNALEVSGPLKGPASVGVAGGEAPYYAALLKCANLAEEITEATSAVYSLSTANTDSVSAYLYLRNAEDNNHRLNFLTGGRGSMSFDFAVKTEAMWTAQIFGASSNDWSDDLAFFDSDGQPALDAAESSLTYLGTATKDDAPRMICRAMTLTLGATPYPVSSASLDLAWTTSPREAVTADQAVSKWINTRGSRPNGNLSLTDGATAYDDVLSKWRAGTEATLTIVLDDGTQKITFAMPNVQLGPPNGTDAGGIKAFDIGYFVNGDFDTHPFGDNSLTITYEASA